MKAPPNTLSKKQIPSSAVCLLSLLLICLTTQNILAQGYLKIQSNIDDIGISVDGVHRGNTQKGILFLELSSGRHKIAADRQNFQRSEYDVTVSEGKVSSLTINLQKSSGFVVKKGNDARLAQELGSITIITDIPGASITLNGKQVPETTPLTVEQLGAGDWEIEASVMGQKVSKYVKVKGSQTSMVRIFFDPNNERSYLRKMELERMQLIREKQQEAREIDLQRKRRELQMRIDKRRKLVSELKKKYPERIKVEFQTDGAPQKIYRKNSSEDWWTTTGGWEKTKYKYRSNLSFKGPNNFKNSLKVDEVIEMHKIMGQIRRTIFGKRPGLTSGTSEYEFAVYLNNRRLMSGKYGRVHGEKAPISASGSCKVMPNGGILLKGSNQNFSIEVHDPSDGKNDYAIITILNYDTVIEDLANRAMH